MREPGKPHLRIRPPDRARDRRMWTCAAVYGVMGYGVTELEAYDAWRQGNALNIDGPIGALRVGPSRRDRAAIQRLKELLYG